MKITYTEAGLKELDRFMEEQELKLQSVIRNRKYVFGDEELEITASDIKEAEKAFEVRSLGRSKIARVRALKLATTTYGVVGILMMAGTLCAPTVLRMFENNGIGLLIFVLGLVITLASFGLRIMIRSVEARRFDRYLELEAKAEKRRETMASLSNTDANVDC